MNCTEARRHWDLYHDSEGDSELYLQINEHLGECPTCAEWFHKQSRSEELISERLKEAPASAESSTAMWNSILTQTRLQRPAAPKKWLGLWSLLVLAAGLLIAVGLLQFISGSDPDLAELTARWHEGVRSGRHPVEFASRSDLDVEAWLRQRVSFPVRCPPRSDSGFQVEGAGISKLADRDAAWLTGSVDGRDVSIFILARDSLEQFPDQQAALRDKAALQSRHGRLESVVSAINGNVVLVVGETDADRLTRVLNAYGTYHEHHQRRGA